MIDCPESGMVRGSKLSGLLYTIYTNEVPRLHNIMTNQSACETKGATFYTLLSVEHIFINFVDGSNSIITADLRTDIEKYTKNYFRLLENYYKS